MAVLPSICPFRVGVDAVVRDVTDAVSISVRAGSSQRGHSPQQKYQRCCACDEFHLALLVDGAGHCQNSSLLPAFPSTGSIKPEPTLQCLVQKPFNPKNPNRDISESAFTSRSKTLPLHISGDTGRANRTSSEAPCTYRAQGANLQTRCHSLL